MTPIAVVGIAAQLPSGNFAQTDFDYHSFFDFLLKKGEAYEPVPPSRFNVEKIRGRAVGQVLTDTGAFLKDLDLFDHMEFGITAKDAKLMTVGLRKLIEVAFLSLCDAGIEYRGKNVGCYMSGVGHDAMSVSGHDDAEVTGSFAYLPAMMANRISYHLDLRGPTIPIDTACSSTLYATHLAVQALRNGECEAAVVGGSQINHRFAEWLCYTQGGVLSPDGKCKPFDVSANGFGRGEGVVSIVLKPLDAALRDHDHVYATVLGTGVNSSGSLVPANAPAAVAQQDAMVRAFGQAGRSPQEVDFIELHATGTAQGDPTEANWIGAQFCREDELVLGSVKGNIGHLEITAFLASLCKVCGIFETGIIPPNVNLTKPNPSIRWKQYRLRVPLQPEPLKVRGANGRPLVAMTSSGIGGANGHAVVEGPPTPSSLPPFWAEDAIVPILLVGGALSPRSSTTLGEELLTAANDSNKKEALARIFGRRARSMPWRSFVVRSSGKTSSLTKPRLAPKIRSPVVFVFSGQGTQHFQMGRQLFKACLPFRSSVLELDAVYKSVAGKSLVEDYGLFGEVAPDAKDSLGDPWPIAITLPALTLLQLALVDTLAAAGVLPDVVVGHSAGETAVLSASGAAPKAMALEIAIARGRAMALVEESKGTMAAVNCSPKDAEKIIGEVNAELGKGVLQIGCYNTAGAVTLSGVETHIDLAVAKATAAGIFARKLKTRVPVHSEMMQLCQEEFTKLVADVFSRYEVSPPNVETYSTMTGRQFDHAFEAQYFWDGTVGPVRFTEAIEALASKYKGITFVEIGPHPVLASYLQTITEGHDNITVTCPLRRPRAPEPGVETFEFVTSLGKIVAAGHNCVDFDALYGSAGSYSGSLPKYPFAPKHVPWLVPTPEIARQRQHRNGPMNYPQLRMNVKTHPGLSDHVIKGEPIMPAAGYVEMALEFGASEVYNVQFHGLLPLSSDRPLPVNVKLDGTKWSVSSATNPDYSANWPINYNRLHATGFLSMEPIRDRGIAPLDLDGIRKRMNPVNMNTFYSDVASFAQFGRMYRRIRRCYISADNSGAVEALTEIRGRDKDIPSFSDHVLHPSILDAAIHVIVNPRLTGNYDPNLYHLPSRIGTCRLCPALKDGPFPATVFCHATFAKWTPDVLTYNFTITNPQGVPLVVLENVDFALHGYRMKALEKRYDVAYRPTELSLAHFRDASVNGVANGHANGHANGNANGDVNGHPNGDATGSVEGDINGNHTSDAKPANPLVIPYTRGEELAIQKQLSQHDPLGQLSIVFLAFNDINGDASTGFTRALRKEYPGWTIRCAVFDSSWAVADAKRAASHSAITEGDEYEFRVDAAGMVSVPRVELAESPNPNAPLDIEQPWKLETDKVVQTSAPLPQAGQATVRVKGVVSRHGVLWQYVGDLEDTSQQVTGITSGSISSHVLVPLGSYIELSTDKATTHGTLQSSSFFASTLVSMALGRLDRRRFSGKVVLIVDEDEELLRQIGAVCSQLGMEVISTNTLSNDLLESCYIKPPSVVLSGLRDAKKIATLRHISAPHGRLSLWNHPETGIAAVAAQDPWALGDALQHALAFETDATITYTPLPSLLEGIPRETAVRSLNLFDPKKAYVLLGGIGSLGLHIALWMYQNGARHIILTSRAGAESLDRRGDYIAQRILVYLRGREDLEVSLAAVDATSETNMSDLFRGLKQPLGGCMHLTTVYSDGTFASHTEETFERAFKPKIDAFKVLEKVVDLNAIDFTIAFASVAGLFGNPGQTNYAAANTALAGLTRKYKNAFTLISPLILDSGILVMNEDVHYATRLRHFIKWGMTARELCDYIGDGILKLRDGPVGEYVPGFDWRVVREGLGASPLYDHLVPVDDDGLDEQDQNKTETIEQIVCRVLDLKENEISIDVPLTTYGVDSLSAVSLSYALRPLVNISQLQLLADVTIKDLQTKAAAAAASAT